MNRNLKGQFKKGTTSWNKGTKGVMKANRTSFKKGQHPSPKTEFKKGDETSKKQRGEKNSNWQNGKSFEPYGIEFNEKLKEQIRAKNNYRCQECFRHQDELRTKNNKGYKLPVHHIDYNKQNNDPDNLISLCLPCHLQTNFKREDWINYFKTR